MQISPFRYLLIILFFFSLKLNAQDDKSNLYLYEDQAKQLTADSAISLFKNGKFKAAKAAELNVGYTRSVYWLAYKNEKDLAADSLLLHIGHHHINRIHFYFSAVDSTELQWVTGDYFPFNQRPVDATGFYFPISKKGIYLARIDKSNESLQLFFSLSSKSLAIEKEANDKFIIFFFTGMICLLLIFGFYLFLITNDKLYIWYLLYIASGWLWVLSNAGYGFQYLWPDLPWFASKARPVFVFAPMIFSLLFLVHYIGGVGKKIRFFIKGINFILTLCIILILFFNEEGYQNILWYYIQLLIPLIALLFALSILGILSYYSIKGNKLAIFYLAAILALITSALVQILFSIGQINLYSKFFSTYGLAIGYIIEAIILTAGLVYRFNSYRLDRETLLKEKNIRLLENTKIMMEVQEAERSQVANQLHDVAGSLLSAIRLNFSSIREEHLIENFSINEKLAKTEEAVIMVSEMVRNLSHALSPVMLKQVGLKTSLEKIINIFNASGKINISLIVIGFEKYDPKLNSYYTVLYSIIYELLNNIVKHSGAKNALLQVTEHDDAFSLIVEDDGIGINHNHEDNVESIGIKGIQSKIDYFKGEVALDKNEPKGLIVTIYIPKLYENK